MTRLYEETHYEVNEPMMVTSFIAVTCCVTFIAILVWICCCKRRTKGTIIAPPSETATAYPAPYPAGPHAAAYLQTHAAHPHTTAPYPHTTAPYPHTNAPYPHTNAPYPATAGGYPHPAPAMPMADPPSYSAATHNEAYTKQAPYNPNYPH